MGISEGGVGTRINTFVQVSSVSEALKAGLAGASVIVLNRYPQPVLSGIARLGPSSDHDLIIKSKKNDTHFQTRNRKDFGEDLMKLRQELSEMFPNSDGGPLLLASGGLYSGQDLAWAITHGADGVSMGTRFAVTMEAAMESDAKLRLLDTFTNRQLRSILDESKKQPGQAQEQQSKDWREKKVFSIGSIREESSTTTGSDRISPESPVYLEKIIWEKEREILAQMDLPYSSDQRTNLMQKAQRAHGNMKPQPHPERWPPAPASNTDLSFGSRERNPSSGSTRSGYDKRSTPPPPTPMVMANTFEDTMHRDNLSPTIERAMWSTLEEPKEAGSASKSKSKSNSAKKEEKLQNKKTNLRERDESGSGLGGAARLSFSHNPTTATTTTTHGEHDKNDHPPLTEVISLLATPVHSSSTNPISTTSASDGALHWSTDAHHDLNGSPLPSTPFSTNDNNSANANASSKAAVGTASTVSPEATIPVSTDELYDDDEEGTDDCRDDGSSSSSSSGDKRFFTVKQTIDDIMNEAIMKQESPWEPSSF